MRCRAMSVALALLFAGIGAMAETKASPHPAAVPVPLAEGFKIVDESTIEPPAGLLEGTSATNSDGTINVVVEIPTGTNAKWEIRDDGKLRWDMKDGKPRVVKYLGYVGDYGMIPKTKQGDGDALDVLLLAPAYPRGTVVAARVIGALLFTDDGAVDNKLVAVVPGTAMESVGNLRELDEGFPGVAEIARIWFEHYKGPKGKMAFKGLTEREAAEKLVRDGESAFAAKSARPAAEAGK